MSAVCGGTRNFMQMHVVSFEIHVGFFPIATEDLTTNVEGKCKKWKENKPLIARKTETPLTGLNIDLTLLPVFRKVGKGKN